MISLGILGATVMPHNLYLHTSLVQTRDSDPFARRQGQAGDQVQYLGYNYRAGRGVFRQRRDSGFGGRGLSRYEARRRPGVAGRLQTCCRR